MDHGIVSVCAGIVTYNPDIDLLRKNVESILPQVEQIVVFDNGSINIEDIKRMLVSYQGSICIGSSKNQGIAYALNRLCEWGVNNQYNWILTLDQDSISPQGLVDNLSKYVDTDVAVIAPNVVYKNNVKAEGIRDNCHCIASRDIGAYNSCLSGCKYCYANRKPDIPKKVIKLHDEKSPLLLGHLKEDD